METSSWSDSPPLLCTCCRLRKVGSWQLPGDRCVCEGTRGGLVPPPTHRRRLLLPEPWCGGGRQVCLAAAKQAGKAPLSSWQVWQDVSCKHRCRSQGRTGRAGRGPPLFRRRGHAPGGQPVPAGSAGDGRAGSSASAGGRSAEFQQAVTTLWWAFHALRSRVGTLKLRNTCTLAVCFATLIHPQQSELAYRARWPSRGADAWAC